MRWTTPLRPEIDFVTLKNQSDAHMTRPGNLTITLHEREIPSFVKTEMERLYQNPFSSVAAEHVSNPDTSTYVVYRDGRPITIFLFLRDRRQVRVLNATIRIGTEDIQRFANYIFDQFKTVAAVSFQSVQLERVDRSSVPLPYQRFNASEDIVLALPDTPQAYLQNLGKSTRKYIKYHLNRPKRHFPTYCYTVCEPDQIDERLIQDIIDLNTARMENKHKVSTIDDAQKEWIMTVAKTYGFVGVARIDGKVCAGVICTRIGANYFMHVIAHDPRYDDYRLGTICCYLTICEAVARSGKEFHFLWGQGDYKYRLLGVQRDLDNLTVYRSRTHYFLNSGLVLKNNFAGYIRRAKLRFDKTDAAIHAHFR